MNRSQTSRRLIIISAIVLSSAIFSSFKPEPKKQQVRNVIFLIGDGMGLSQISYALQQSANRLNFERFQYIGLSKTSSSNSQITDSAAGATAFSIGKKTYNGAIGVDDQKRSMKTILEYAEDKGLATGMLVTCAITHATPAAFIAHQPSRTMQEEIAQDFLKTDIDLFIGGGLQFFNKRKDAKDLTVDLKEKGYTLILHENELYQAGNSKKIAALLADNHLPKMQDGRGNYESQAADFSMQFLNKNKNGFFLMIEGSQIDWGGHDNDAAYINEETQDFDRVIGKVLDFAAKDGNTLVIVTADHETGGFALTPDPKMESKSENYGNAFPAFTSKGHSSTMVPVFAYGPGASDFAGIYENTELFFKIKKALNINK